MVRTLFSDVFAGKRSHISEFLPIAGDCVGPGSIERGGGASVYLDDFTYRRQENSKYTRVNLLLPYSAMGISNVK